MDEIGETPPFFKRESEVEEKIKELHQKLEDLEDLFLTTNLGLVELKRDLDEIKFKFGGVSLSSEFESKLEDLEKKIKNLEEKISNLEKKHKEISDDFLRLTEFLKVKTEELSQVSERVGKLEEKFSDLEETQKKISEDLNYAKEILKKEAEDFDKILKRMDKLEEKISMLEGKEKPLKDEKSLEELESILEMGRKILEKLKKKESAGGGI